LLGFALFWTAFSSIFLVIGLREEELVFTLVGGLFVLIGVALLIWALLTFYSRMRLGKPDIQISETTLRVGAPFTVSYFHTFPRSVELEGIRVKLIFRETATYQQGTDTTTVTHDEVIEEFSEPGGRFNSGMMVQQAYQMHIPRTSMHTLKVRRNQLQWFVRFEIGVPRLPDYVDEYELDVLPAMA